MKRIIATFVASAALAVGVAACGTNGSASSPAPRHVAPITTETVPPRSVDPLEGYTWASPVIRLTVGRAFSAALFDQTCVLDKLEATYPTPSAFSHDYDVVGGEAVVAKTGVEACLLTTVNA